MRRPRRAQRATLPVVRLSTTLVSRVDDELREVAAIGAPTPRRLWLLCLCVFVVT